MLHFCIVCVRKALCPYSVLRFPQGHRRASAHADPQERDAAYRTAGELWSAARHAAL